MHGDVIYELLVRHRLECAQKCTALYRKCDGYKVTRVEEDSHEYLCKLLQEIELAETEGDDVSDEGDEREDGNVYQ